MIHFPLDHINLCMLTIRMAKDILVQHVNPKLIIRYDYNSNHPWDSLKKNSIDALVMHELLVKNYNLSTCKFFLFTMKKTNLAINIYTQKITHDRYRKNIKKMILITYAGA